MTARNLAKTIAAILLAVASLPLFGGDSDVRKLEKQLTNDRDSSVRAQAAWDLGQMGSTESVPLLGAALSDPSEAVRANAAASLWKLGAASKSQIARLTRALEDPSPAVVENAAGALRKLGVPKAQIQKAYRDLLKQPDCEARVMGLKGLVDDVPPTELFDDAWACSLDRDSNVSHDAKEVLRKIVTRRDRIMVPLILDALENLGRHDGTDLISAIGDLDPPVKETVPILVKHLSDTRDEERTPRAAVSALGHMGSAALPAVPAMVALLNSNADVDTKTSAAEALGRLGPKAAAAAVPGLMKAAGDKWPKVRTASLSALGEMGPAAHDAIPLLRTALKDPDGFISQAARNALFRVQPDKKEEASAISDQSRPEEAGILFENVSQLASTLPGKIPEVFELVIYDKFAMATAPYSESRSGRGKFTYRAGTVTGPDEESGSDCEKKIALSKVDFSIVPRLVREAPGLLGSPSGKVSLVMLGGGVFCNKIGWIVHVDKAGFVEFRLDGKVGKVQKL